MDYVSSEKIGFNPGPATVMHVDLNSCFASIEQQANPLFRGKPLAVAAYTTAGGCVLAASREAKTFGVKTGIRVGEARALCRNLIVIPSDPWKYRYINRKLVALLRTYTSDVEIKSIDEMVLQLGHSPSLEGYLKKGMDVGEATSTIGRQIKDRIKKDIGDWLTVSVGIAPNRYLAKIGAGLHKPDGLDEIAIYNVERILSGLPLEELCGIKTGYGSRLRRWGIDSALSFYHAPIKLLTTAFHSVIGYHWWLRLHGWEADDRQFDRKSFGQSYALYKPYVPSDKRIRQILCQLTEKMARRMRRHGYVAGGIHVACLFSDYSFWHRGRRLAHPLFAGSDLFQAACAVLADAPDRPVRIFAVSAHYLEDNTNEQQQLFVDTARKKALTGAIDALAERWGEFTVVPAILLSMEHKILDRIAFGGVKDLEEFVFRDTVTRETIRA